MEIIKWKSIFQFSALQLYKSAVFLSLCRFFLFFCERGKLQLSNLLIMRKERLFKTLLLFGLAALSLTATAGDKKRADFPSQGYRGSFDFAWADNFNKDRTYFSPQFSTTHGYQIMPELYTGIGVLFDLRAVNFGSRIEHTSNENSVYSISPFLTVRYDICKKKVSPYVEGRIGYRVLSGCNLDDEIKYDELYAVPMVGIRLNHFNIAVSYEWITVGGYNCYGGNYMEYYMTKRYSAIGFHAGFDFGARKKQ